MARPPACCNFCQNSPPIGEDEPAGLAPTEGSNTYIFAPAVSRTPTPTLPAVLALALAPATVDLMVRYLAADL